jgi:hypothetical protein
LKRHRGASDLAIAPPLFFSARGALRPATRSDEASWPFGLPRLIGSLKTVSRV